MALNAASEVSANGITYRLTRSVAVIELSRPEAGNALDLAMKHGLLAAVRRIHTDGDRVRAVLLTARGPRFCVGQDLREHADALAIRPALAFATVRREYNPIVEALHSIEQPVVAAIEGACMGAGLGLALCADIRVAAHSARFATAFTGIGLAGDTGVSGALVRALGHSRAMGLMLLGDHFSAQEAAQWGLVHRLAADEQAAAEGLALAERLAHGPTAAYREVKTLLRDAGELDLPALLDREAGAQERLGTTRDHAGAVKAFLSRSAPAFTGR
ncbi:enoyl-CoA hydratase/isomerase family protein [Streptomyces sp. NPDC056773]|uniref:enoyl-CoA hydratase/isomerase family protein n=1 Tax=unclassified Streptomyces TaxID=2593676 RepID=UPI0036CB08E3